MSNIVTIKFGTKYTDYSVNTLYEDIKKNYPNDFDFWCLTEDSAGLDPNIKIIHPSDVNIIHNTPNESHWNRFLFFSDIFEDNKEVITLDIDLRIRPDIDHLFDVPLQTGDFLGIHRWWNLVSYDFTYNQMQLRDILSVDNLKPSKKYFETITGAFYKFLPSEQTKYMHKEFMTNPRKYIDYWSKMRNIPKGLGEQNTVNDFAKFYCNLKVFSGKHIFTYYTDTKYKNYSEYNLYQRKLYRKLFDEEFDKDNIYILQTVSTDESRRLELINNDEEYKYLLCT